MGSADAAQMQLQVPAGITELSLKMKSEYGCQFSNVDPKICELIYETNRHFRNMRRQHEYAHTPLGWKQFEEMLKDDVYNDNYYNKKAGRRSNSSERFSSHAPRTRRFSRRTSSADRALSAESRIPYGLNNYEDYVNKNDEPTLSPKYASIQNKARNTNRPKVRIKLPPFVAYGGGCASREIGEMKTYNVNAANVSKNSLPTSQVNGILKTNKSRVFESENGVPIAKIMYRPMTGSWLPTDVIADWKTEYRSNYCC